MGCVVSDFVGGTLGIYTDLALGNGEIPLCIAGFNSKHSLSITVPNMPIPISDHPITVGRSETCPPIFNAQVTKELTPPPNNPEALGIGLAERRQGILRIPPEHVWQS